MQSGREESEEDIGLHSDGELAASVSTTTKIDRCQEREKNSIRSASNERGFHAEAFDQVLEVKVGGRRSDKLRVSIRKRPRNHHEDGIGVDAKNEEGINDSERATEAAAHAGDGGERKEIKGDPDGHSSEGVLQQRWDVMFDRLVAFKTKHGHCLVPNRYEGDRSLGAWVSTQRRHYKTNKASESGSTRITPLTPERVKRLQDVGFVWATSDPRHTSWNVRFEQLKAYRETHGNCLVPIGFKENVQLSNWVSTQRQDYKAWKEGQHTRMTPRRIQLLNSIGMVWDAQRGGNRQRGRYVPMSDYQQSRAAFGSDNTTLPATGERQSLKSNLNPQPAMHDIPSSSSATSKAQQTGHSFLSLPESNAPVRSTNTRSQQESNFTSVLGIFRNPGTSDISIPGTGQAAEGTAAGTFTNFTSSNLHQGGISSFDGTLLRNRNPQMVGDSSSLLATLTAATNRMEQVRAAQNAWLFSNTEGVRRLSQMSAAPALPNYQSSIVSEDTRERMDALASRILRETSSLATAASFALLSSTPLLSDQQQLTNTAQNPMDLYAMTGTHAASLTNTLYPPYQRLVETETATWSRQPSATRFGAASSWEESQWENHHGLLFGAFSQAMAGNANYTVRRNEDLLIAALGWPSSSELLGMSMVGQGTPASRAFRSSTREGNTLSSLGSEIRYLRSQIREDEESNGEEAKKPED